MTIVIAIISQKGGVGKSIVASNLAAEFSNAGYKTLLIDTDPQGSGLDWIDKRETHLPKITGATLLTRHLKNQVPDLSKPFDITILDCKGTLDDAVKAALVTADFFITPMQPSPFDLASTEKFIDKCISEVASFKEIEGGILINSMKRSVIAKEIVDHIKNRGDIPVFDSQLPTLVAFEEASNGGLGVCEYKPQDKSSIAFKAFFVELCEILGFDYGKKLQSRNKKSARKGATRRRDSAEL